MNQRILLIYTGGTIGMWPSNEGYTPKKGFAALLQQRLNQVSLSALEPFDIIELDNLIDSSNIQLNDWTQLAALIQQHYDNYAGFVVLHGTDTMAYTASALSFLLLGCQKPVILTGSQIPLAQPRTDATNNLLNAIAFARQPDIKEVCVCFDSQLFRGNRTRKVDTSALHAFDSPNLPPIATIGINLHIRESLKPTTPAFKNAALTPCVAQLLIYPGISNQQIDAALRGDDIKGVVLMSYGAGNPPDSNAYLMQALEEASQAGKVIINLTQCFVGRVIQGAYATGEKLNKIGVVPGADLTPEAAYTKLLVLFATQDSIEEIKRIMGQSLCGELSDPEECA